MNIREFIKRCETGFDDIYIIDAGSGEMPLIFHNMKEIKDPDLLRCKILSFEFGVCTEEDQLEFVLCITI